jgi:ABC-2 type transport system permease protein
MIGLVRYGFLGYSDVSIVLSLGFLTVATTILLGINLRLFNRGYRLRA